MSLALQQVTALSPGALPLPQEEGELKDQRSWCFLNKEAGKRQGEEQPGNDTNVPRAFLSA